MLFRGLYAFCLINVSISFHLLATKTWLLRKPIKIAASSTPWYAEKVDGLNFKCTGCGKCCQNDGEVWFDASEFSDVSDYLNITLPALVDGYTDSIVGGWAKMKNHIDPDPSKPDKCIFLAEDGKQCSIYSVRPNQCRTYPWWPRLLMNESSWYGEAVVPDDATEGKKWTSEGGGCEGVNHADASPVSTLKISRNNEINQMYTNNLPLATFLSPAEERQRFLSKTEVMKAVIKSTKSWVKDFVVKYTLCPFAESVFVSGKIRYKVFLGSGTSEIIEMLKFEMLHLLTNPEEEVATTLVIFPFAFPNFEEFYDFSIELEDEIIPSIEASTRPAYTNKNYLALKKTPENKLKKLFSKRKQASSGLGVESSRKPESSSGACPVSSASENDEEIQIAAFHPGFQWADSELNDPLNFEKRAPFPTINLLRAEKIRQYANEGQTAAIAKSNEHSLVAAGSDALVEEFERIIRQAIDDTL